MEPHLQTLNFKFKLIVTLLGTFCGLLVAPQVDAEPNITPPVSEENIPNAVLTDQIFFQTLSSEIAAQRGQIGPAYGTLMSMANQTHDPRFAKRATEIAWGNRYADDAIAAARTWLLLSPKSEEAFQSLQAMLVATGKLNDLSAISQEHYAQYSSDQRIANLVQLQRLLTRSQDKDAVTGIMEKLAAQDTNRYEPHLILARTATQFHDDAKAQQETQTALKINPDSELALLTHVQLIQQTEPDKTIKLIRDFLSRNPKAIDARVTLTRLLIEQKQSSAVRQEMDKLEKSTTTFPKLLLSLASLSLEASQPDQAEKYLTTYVDRTKNAARQKDNSGEDTEILHGSDLARSYQLLSQIAEDRGNLTAALDWINKLDESDRSAQSEIKRATLLGKIGKLQESREVLAKLATSNLVAPADRYQISLTEAQILRDAGKPQEAFNVLSDALNKTPNQPELLYDYAMAAEKLDKLDVMEGALRKLIEIRPQNQHAYNALGYSLADRKQRLPEALELVQKAVSLAPDDAFIIDSLGWVYYRMGNLDKSLTYLRQAYELKQDVEIGAHLGEVLWESGQRNEAQKYWKEVLKTDPKNETLRAVLGKYKTGL